MTGNNYKMDAKMDTIGIIAIIFFVITICMICMTRNKTEKFSCQNKEYYTSTTISTPISSTPISTPTPISSTPPSIPASAPISPQPAINIQSPPEMIAFYNTVSTLNKNNYKVNDDYYGGYNYDESNDKEEPDNIGFLRWKRTNLFPSGFNENQK